MYKHTYKFLHIQIPTNGSGPTTLPCATAPQECVCFDSKTTLRHTQFQIGVACSGAETSDSNACEAYVLSWGIKYQQKTSARQQPTGECIAMADLSGKKII